MHQQMLARYDTERVIAGLDRVVSRIRRASQDGRPDYTSPIPEGYGSEGYTRRRAGRSFAELPDAVEECAAWHERLTVTIAAGRLDFGDGPSLGALDGDPARLRGRGGRAQHRRGRDRRRIDRGRALGNLHGSGHGHAGALGEGPDPLGWGGVMYWTETAICDPFFYRWHKHIDDLCASFQEASGETNDPAAHAPDGVSFGGARSIVLCLSRDIPGSRTLRASTSTRSRATASARTSTAPTTLLTRELLTRFVRSRVTAGIPGAGARDLHDDAPAFTSRSPTSCASRTPRPSRAR